MVLLSRVSCELPLPISRSVRLAAKNFAAAHHSNPARANQVALNTLAVGVVNDYLQWMDIPTDLAGSDSWNLVTQLTSDTADLLLPELGRLECRPILPESTICSIPPDAQYDRIGYLVVRIANNHRDAALLGFTPRLTGEWLSLEHLQPPETLFDHLEDLKLRQIEPRSLPVQLGQWLRGQFEPEWQSLDSLLHQWDTSAMTLSFRSGFSLIPTQADSAATVRRARVIDLGLLLDNQPLTVVVAVTPQDDQLTNILVQVAPIAPRFVLPAGLRLQVRDAAEVLVREVQSRHADNYMQLRIYGSPGEQFRVQIGFAEVCFSQVFLI